MSSDDAEKGDVVESLPQETDVAGEAKTEMDASFDMEEQKEKLSSPNMSLRVVGFLHAFVICYQFLCSA